MYILQNFWTISLSLSLLRPEVADRGAGIQQPLPVLNQQVLLKAQGIVLTTGAPSAG